MTTKPQQQPHTAPLISILSLLLFQTLFYLTPITILYWIITLNYHMLAICGIISIVQKIVVVGRNEGYVRWVGKYLRVGQYAGIQRMYQEGVGDEGVERTLFCYHPHSVFGYGIMLNANHPWYPDEKLSRGVIIGSNFVLNLPITDFGFANLPI